MRILITGGAGYIGSVLTPMLLDGGYKVRVMDVLMYGGSGLLSVVGRKGFEFVKGDVCVPEDVENAAKDCDVIIHLAAIVGFPACRKNPELAERVNVLGTHTVAQAVGPERLMLYASTGSNYGALTDEVCTEETPLNPLSHYGRTKTAAEQFLLDRGNTIAYRFATAFGMSPRLRLDLLVNEFVYSALTQRHLVVYEKDFMRSFIHVKDIARSFIFAIENADKMNGEVYNIGNETMNYSKAEMCDMIKNKIDYYLHYAEFGTDADKRNYVVSYEKIRNLGFSTTISLDEGIDELIQGLQLVNVANTYTNV